MGNIFAGYGKIATGNNYICRYELEKELKNRTWDQDNFGSVSVVGMQRMGKSSLVYNMYIAKQDELYKNNIISVSISMNNYSTADEFFIGIIDCVYELLTEYEELDVKVESKYNRVLKTPLKDGGVKCIQGFFKQIIKSGKRVICIIDEFDYSKQLFSSYPEGFNILRELAYQPDTNVSFVFVSRRMVSELETSVGISTLANILGKPIYVKPYHGPEIDDYHRRMTLAGVAFDVEETNELDAITGYQPYWCDTIMSYYCDSPESERILQKVYEKNKGTFFTEYENMMKLLDEQNLLSALFQILVGPAFDYTQTELQRLYDYGIITFKGGEVKAISDRFYDYLKVREGKFDFYPLWNMTERNLRVLMKKKLEEKYGDEWEETIKTKYISTESNHPMSLSNYLREAEKLQEKVKKQTDLYVQDTIYSIIEGLTTAGLFALYLKEYSMFQPIFVMDKNEFSKMSAHLTKARNPYQHNNDDLIDPAFKNITKGYCELLLKKMNLGGTS